MNVEFTSRNLKINEGKTEDSFLHRGNCTTQTQKNVKKESSLLGDSEDIIPRKQLAISSMNKIQAVWIRRDHIGEEKRLRLYNCLVLPVLLYNFSTWRLNKKDENTIDLFHRSQLRYLIGKKFPFTISNVNLYKRCKSYTISLFILKFVGSYLVMC